MGWTSVNVGDLIEYKLIDSKKRWGIYLGVTRNTYDISDGMITGEMPLHFIMMPNGTIDIIDAVTEDSVKVSVRAAIDESEEEDIRD